VSTTELPRRRTGLWLVLGTLVIALGAYVNVGLGKRDRLPANIALYGSIMAIGYLGCWLLMRRYARGADPVLFPAGGLLAGLGFAVIFRLDGGLAAEQITWLMVALVAFAVTLVVIRDDRQLEGLTYTIGLAALVLLILPVVPGIGTEINGARLWIRVANLTFQPSELGKVLMVAFLASYLTTTRELLAEGVGRLGLPRVKDLGPMLLAWGASLVVLFAEKDLGASLLYFGIFVVMLWLSTGRLAYLVIGVLLFAAGAYVGYLVFGHVQLRVDYWLHAIDPGKPFEQGYGQLAQGWFGMASGGLVGAGLGQGSPWLIPYAETDFIFAAIGEELGMLGTAAVLLLYITLIGRGMRIAMGRTDAFGKLLAAGLTTIFALQTFVIVGGVTRLIPLTGITLPFVSYGGSSLLSNFIILALLVRISAGAYERLPSPRLLARAEAGRELA
jgi:cell division protein FtsW (lipid II flippase)